MTVCKSCANVVSKLVALLHTASAACSCMAVKGTGVVTRETMVMSTLNETKDCIVACPSKWKKIKKGARNSKNKLLQVLEGKQYSCMYMISFRMPAEEINCVQNRLV